MNTFVSYLESIADDSWVSTLVMGCIILIATGIVSFLLTRFTRRLLTHDSSPLPSSSIFITIVRTCVWIVGVSVICSVCFNINLTAVIGALGIGGLAVSLGFQDTISNLIAGVQISLLGTVQPGDFVEIQGRKGFVHDVSLRYTTITTLASESVVVPNSVINASALIKLPPATTVRVPFSVINTDPNLDDIANGICNDLCAELPSINLELTPRVVYTGCTDFAVTGTLIFDILDEEEYLNARDKALRIIGRYTCRKNQESAQICEA